MPPRSRQKGWLDGVVAEYDASEFRLVIYDEARLTQEVQDALASAGFFAEGNVLVVPQLTRECIDAAVERLSRGGFRDLRN
jgi:hypothetical protein